MKYSVSCRQPNSVLKRADEIKVEYKDKEIIYKLMEEFSDKKYVLIIPEEENDINWTEIKTFSEKIKNFIVSLENIKKANACIKFKIKFMWAYPITSFYELSGLMTIGVSEIKLGAPLYFDLPQVVKFGVPIRLVANVCYDNYIPRMNGIKGTYVRPEDVPVYEKYIETLEFVTDDLAKEEILLTVYKDDKKWPGNLNIILTNFKLNIDNKVIPPQFGEARVQCRQNCQRTGSCKLCENIIEFAINAEGVKHEWVPQVGFKKQ